MIFKITITIDANINQFNVTKTERSSNPKPLAKFIKARWFNVSDRVELNSVSTMKTQMLLACAILVLLVAGKATTQEPLTVR